MIITAHSSFLLVGSYIFPIYYLIIIKYYNTINNPLLEFILFINFIIFYALKTLTVLQ